MARHGLSWFSFISMLLVAANCGMAGVALGPKTDDDAAEAEQRRIIQFYEAQKSNQDKLKAGQQRFEQKQANRIKLIAAMKAELAARKETVAMQSDTVSYAEKIEPRTWTGTLLGGGVIGLAFLGFRYYLSRQDANKTVSR